jgi:hypothetical protein
VCVWLSFVIVGALGRATCCVLNPLKRAAQEISSTFSLQNQGFRAPKKSRMRINFIDDRRLRSALARSIGDD